MSSLGQVGLGRVVLKMAGVPPSPWLLPACPSQEHRLAEMETLQAQMGAAIQTLQHSRTPGQPLPLKVPCLNGDTT